MISVEININKTTLGGNPELLLALYEHLSFRHPNAFFIKKKMHRHWDGMIHPLTNGGKIATGLLDSCIAFLVDQGETDFRVKDLRPLPKFTEEMVTHVAGFELRPYQVASIQAIKENSSSGVVANPRGILQLSMNAGKTLLAMALYENIVDAKVLILLSSSVLYKQFKDDLAKAYPDDYGFMQGKAIKWGSIMVCMIHTLKNRLIEYNRELRDYNVLLVDECELGASKTAETIYNKLWHIGVRIGLTGTAFIRNLAKDRIRNLEMRKLFGEALFEVTMKDLEDMGVSTPVEVILYEGNKGNYQGTSFLEEFNHNITENKSRTRKLIRLVKKEKRQGYMPMLIVNRFVKQCENIFEEVSKALPHTSVGIIHTNTSSKEKAQVIKDFRSGRVEILVANLLIKRGMNFPLIQCIINNSGGEHPSTPLQVLGRGTRAHETKTIFHFIDFMDKGRYLTRHSKGRVIAYKRQSIKIRNYDYTRRIKE